MLTLALGWTIPPAKAQARDPSAPSAAERMPAVLRDLMRGLPPPGFEPEEQDEDPPGDWAAWQRVTRLRGEATVTYQSSGQESYGDHRRVFGTTESTRLHFTLERLEGQASQQGDWHAVEVRVRYGGGSWFAEQSNTRWSRGSSEFSYTGGARDASETGLRIDFLSGAWQITTPGFAEQPYKEHFRGSTFEGSPPRLVPKDDGWPRDSLLNAVFDGTAPREPSAFSASLSLDQSQTLPRGAMTALKSGSIVLEPEFDDVELRVEIEGYEDWLPLGNIASPDQPGGRLAVRAKLVPRSEKPLPRARRFRFELTEVTREPGVAMNWPHTPGDDEGPFPPDLRFAEKAPGRSDSEALAWEVEAPGPVVEATLESLDFGAAGTLLVKCTLEDGRTLIGRIEREGEDLRLIPVPYRRPGSLIAEAWRRQHQLDEGDAADRDLQPVGDGNEGDGFSHYEEYRGFVHGGRHLRTDPHRKDLFVLNAYGPEAVPGLQLLARISGLDVHGKLESRELELARWNYINYRRSARSPRSTEKFQSALVMKALPTGTASYVAIPDDEPVWRPGTAFRGVYVLRSLKAPGLEQELAQTVAHELLHAIGVRHHGEIDPGYVTWLRREREVNGVREAWFEERPAEYADGRWTYPDAPGKVIRIFANPHQELLPVAGVLDEPRLFWVGVHRGQHSGMVDCVMRYNVATASIDQLWKPLRYLSPGETTGMSLCKAQEGTDYNSPQLPLPRFHNAARGNCAHQFCVRDDAPVR